MNTLTYTVTSNLHPGDIVHTDALQVLILDDPIIARGWNSDEVEARTGNPFVYSFPGVIINLHELDATTRRFVTAVSDADDLGEVTWTIQGNDLATWEVGR